jgi:hypothetical protein
MANRVLARTVANECGTVLRSLVLANLSSLEDGAPKTQPSREIIFTACPVYRGLASSLPASVRGFAERLDYSRLKKLGQSTDHEPKTAERLDWVELIGTTVTRIPEFYYGTIARPTRP